jgi:hypothetical protein
MAEAAPASRLQGAASQVGVESTFSWLGQNRRMSKEYERLPESSAALVYAAMSRLMVRRLARA